MGQIHHNVSYQTGSLNFSLPLLSLKVDDGLEIPINLIYAGNGIKFDQQTGEVGLGWGLTTNYKVNRTIYGRPDEHYAKPSDQQLYDLSASTDNEWRDIQITQFTVGLPSNGGLTLKSGLQELDSEYDLFDYNTPSVTGTFIIESAANKTIASSDNPLIKIDYNVDPINGINSINIKDTKGNNYLAGYDPATNSYFSESIPRYGKQASYSWPITKITSPNNKSAEIKYTLTDIFEMSVGQLGTRINETNGMVPGYPFFFSSSNDELDKSVPNRKSYLTSSVKSQYGEIKLFRFPNSKLIDSAVLYDHNQVAVKRVKFNRSVSHNHVFLVSVLIYGDDQQKAQVYNFDYYQKNNQFTYNADIWGNIKASSSSLKRYPEELKYEPYYDLSDVNYALIERNLLSVPGSTSLSFDDRSPSGVPNAFSLEKITLPTGGTISYTYEANFFRDLPSNQVKQGPGIRLSAIMKHDPTANISETVTYKYGENEDGVGNIPAPVDKYQFGLDQIMVQRGPMQDPLNKLYATRSRFFSNDIISDGDPFFTNYNYVSYPVVSEKTTEGAKKLYYKDGKNMTWYLNQGQNTSFYSVLVSGNLPTTYRPGFVYEYNMAYKPLVQKIEILNQANQVIKKDTFVYNLAGGKTFLQMKVKPYAIFSDGAFSPEYNHIYTGFQSIYDYWLCTMHFGDWLLVKKETTEKRDTLFVTETAEYSYNSDHQLTKEILYMSDNSKKETQFSYPNDFSDIIDGDDISWYVLEMQNSNQLDKWVEKRTYAIRNNGFGEVSEITGAELQFNFPGTDRVRNVHNYWKRPTDAAFNPATVLNNLVQIDDKYHQEIYETVMVDNIGNVLMQIDQQGLPVTYLWGYKRNYPVAKIVGTDYYTVIQHLDTSILNNGSELQIKQELNQMRNALADNPSVQVYTYTYRPLTGLTSETNPKGISTYYEYDDMGRLICVRDHNNKIIRRICYNYNGQPESCP